MIHKHNSTWIVVVGFVLVALFKFLLDCYRRQVVHIPVQSHIISGCTFTYKIKVLAIKNKVVFDTTKLDTEGVEIRQGK